MRIEELENELKSGKLETIYFLYGPETFLLETCVKKIKKNFGELIVGINYIIIEETNLDELISQMETPAFGYEKKLILVKNTGILKKEGKKKNVKLDLLKEDISQYIEENIEIIKESVILVFIEEETEKSNLYKTIEKYGTICEFEFQKPNQIAKRIKAICNGYKVNVSENTLKYLIEFCGTDMQVLINEARKLIEFTGEGNEIKIETIDQLCIKQIDSVIFDLTDHLGRKNILKSLEVLNDLLYAKEPLQKILITIYGHFKKLYLTKLSEEYKKDLAGSLKLKPNQMFLVSKYKQQALLFEKEILRQIMYELMLLDVGYKSGLIDLKIGLESILCMYCA